MVKTATKKAPKTASPSGQASKKPAAKTARKLVSKKATVARVKAKSAPAKKSASPVAEEGARVRIRVSAYEHKLLDASVKQIIDTAMRHGAHIRGPVPLPTEIKKYTVNRAAFIYKNAREQFEMRVHKRLIDIVNPSAPLIEALTTLTLPSGVSIDVKMM